MLPSQHGFMPGRGTLTAWKQILKDDLLAKPFIYECDFVSFFDTVSLGYLSDRMLEMGFPVKLVDYLYDLNSSPPRLPSDPKDHLLDEWRVHQKIESQRWTRVFRSLVRQALGEARSLRLRAVAQSLGVPPLSGVDLANQLILAAGLRASMESDWLGRPLVGSVSEFQIPNRVGLVEALEWLLAQQNRFWDVYNSGMPQGFPTSPFMSMLSLRSFLTQQTSVSYADDPVFFGDTEFEIKACGPANQQISVEKSS